MDALKTILLVVVVGSGTWAVADDQSAIRLSNSHLALRFDRRTGAWFGFADHHSGDELVIGPVSRSMILPHPHTKTGHTSNPPGRGLAESPRPQRRLALYAYAPFYPTGRLPSGTNPCRVPTAER
jgi:hypothetical protein